MARPGGYSSEDDFDDDFYDLPRRKPVQPVKEVKLTPDEQLLDAAQKGDALGVRKALENGANVHCVSPGQHKWTAIMWAAFNGDVELIKLLLSARANPNDHFEMRTVLMGLCDSPCRDEKGLLVCSEHLIESGADFNASDWMKVTPLMYACWRNHERIVRQLIELGADLEASSGEGWTPIFFAVDGGHHNIVKLLKEKGANLEVYERFGRNLEEFALEKGFDEIANLVSTVEKEDVYDEQANEALKRLNRVEYILSECPDIHKDRLYGFRSEVIRIVNASNLRMLLPKIIEHDIQLGHLLVWDESQWEKTGAIQLSYHRTKLSTMARKFHLHPFGTESVRVLKPGEDFNVIDAAQMMCNALRQFHILSLSSLYCQKYETDIDQESLEEVLIQTKRIFKDIKIIQLESRRMQDSVETADCVQETNNSRIFSTSLVTVTCLIGLALTAGYFHVKLVR